MISVPANPLSDSFAIRPKVHATKMDEDAAVYNREKRLQVTAERQAEAANVNESLELTYKGLFEDAMGKLKDIPRISPFADWRLFIRGLHSFYKNDLESARQNWTRLDAARRPSRIAKTLIFTDSGYKLGGVDSPDPPASLVQHSAALRQRTPAIVAANAIANFKHHDPNVTFATSQVSILTNFFEVYRKLDVEFANTFGQACVQLSVYQGDLDTFNRLIKIVPGPKDDPKWNRTRCLYLMGFEELEEDVLEAANQYIDQDLPKLSQFPQTLKDALACCVYMAAATYLRENLMQDGLRAFTERCPSIDELLRKAIDCYPAFLNAHQARIGLMKKVAESEFLEKPEQEALGRKIVEAQAALVRRFPYEIDTTLELIDHYLDSSQLELADDLVQQLSSQRLEAPLAKALPWKLKMLAAMRLSKKKSELVSARNELDEAEKLWPSWLSRDWLPFLRGAIAFRSGDVAQCTQLIATANQTQGLSEMVSNVMTFAAFQRMNVAGRTSRHFGPALIASSKNRRVWNWRIYLGLGPSLGFGSYRPNPYRLSTPFVQAWKSIRRKNIGQRRRSTKSTRMIAKMSATNRVIVLTVAQGASANRSRPGAMKERQMKTLRKTCRRLLERFLPPSGRRE
jgi:hypothetical protein